MSLKARDTDTRLRKLKNGWIEMQRYKKNMTLLFPRKIYAVKNVIQPLKWFLKIYWTRMKIIRKYCSCSSALNVKNDKRFMRMERNGITNRQAVQNAIHRLKARLRMSTKS